MRLEEVSDHAGLCTILAYVAMCAPNGFPGPNVSAIRGTTDLDHAFGMLRRAVDAVFIQPDQHAKKGALLDALDQSLKEYRAGQRHAGMMLLQWVQTRVSAFD